MSEKITRKQTAKSFSAGANSKAIGKVVKESYVGWLFVLPLVLGLVIFTFYPIIQSLVYSFAEYDGVEFFQFVGFKNFETMFLFDSDFPIIVKNTFVYAIITVPLSLVLSYLLALLVNKTIKGVGIFRVLYYLPVVIPGVIAGLLWKSVFDPVYGLGNTFLNDLGLPSSNFLESEKTAMLTMIVMGLWGVGGGMILWLAALKNIPVSLYEAARIDGASSVVKLFKITIPMSTSMIFFNLITGIIGSLQTFSSYIVANNDGRGPNDSLFFYAVKIYNEAFAGDKFNYGYASALAWFLFIVIGVMTFIVFKTSKWVYYGEEQ